MQKHSILKRTLLLLTCLTNLICATVILPHTSFAYAKTAKGPSGVIAFEYSSQFKPQQIAKKLAVFVRKCWLKKDKKFSSYKFAGQGHTQDGWYIVSLSRKSKKQKALVLSFLINTAKNGSGHIVAARGELYAGDMKSKIRSSVRSVLRGTKGCS